MDEDSMDAYDNPDTKMEIGNRLNKRLKHMLKEKQGTSTRT